MAGKVTGRPVGSEGIHTPHQLARALKKYGSLKAVSRQTKTPWGRVHDLYQAGVQEGTIKRMALGAKSRKHVIEVVLKKGAHGKAGRRKAMQAVKVERHPEQVTRFLFTCAQNNTNVFEPGWKNLLLLADVYDAKLHVSRFAYIRAGLGSRGDKFAAFRAAEDYKKVKDFWFDERIGPYVSDQRLEIAPGLVWCGEANILPTAARPLSSMETYTGRKSGIFPHVKIAMESIASSKLDPVKFNYTTGTITLRNYIQRKEGLKAEFHHCYGALLVEVDPEGNWWCRQINMDSEGTIYDIDICIKNGKVTTNNKALALLKGCDFVDTTFLEGCSWGDKHVAQMDPAVREAIWGEGGVIDVVRPKHQFMHDTFDMFARNHHEMDDPYTLLQRHVAGKDSVHREVIEVGDFLHQASRPFTATHVVNSNHDRAILRWLKDKRGQYDPVNFPFWAQLNARLARAVVVEGKVPVVLEEAISEATSHYIDLTDMNFLAQDESFIICPQAGGGIECGQHGDDGQNGARGSTAGFARMGRKMNKGHDHTACIRDSVYSSGCCLDLKNPPGYAHGPSSWSNSHVATYLNGKRQIWTQWGDERKMWADRWTED